MWIVRTAQQITSSCYAYYERTLSSMHTIYGYYAY